MRDVVIGVMGGVAGSVFTLAAIFAVNGYSLVHKNGGAEQDAELASDFGPGPSSDEALALNNGAETLPEEPDSTQVEQLWRDASQERSQLAASVVALNQRIAELEGELINYQSLTAQNPQSMAPGTAGGDDVDGSATNVPISDRGSMRRLEGLLAAGIDPQFASELQAREDQFALARLELLDRAEREGWRDSEQFSDRLDELEDERVDLRAELGDDAYDQYLYELGRSNRVVVASVISGSAADGAGLNAGDLILSYADSRIFSTNDLQTSTRSGVRGESVLLIYERQGLRQSVDVPRGPLGVTLSTSRHNPS
ncbi:MAG: PDZ domain-containing protein [Granulosicoccus sp.]|nr:PDZ domain-containing protein [Granulosicoccus sp.]